jgi:peptide/nickel transport system substrate-binding protein
VAVLASAVALVLLAAGCGGDDTATEPGTGPDGTARQQLIETDTEVTPGGALIFGLEAETDGWNPVQNRWAVSGHQVGQAIFDQLATFNADGEAVPYLLESWEADDTFEEWTLTLREGVEFHDGTPVNGEAIVVALEGHLNSGLTAPAVRPIESVDVVPGDELSAVVTMNEPWASFPVTLAGQVGYLLAPSMMEAEDRATRAPVGSGPFMFEEWVDNNRLVVLKNENYWRTDEAGKDLPYLNSIEFRPIPEAGRRADALRSGDINLYHTTDTRSIEGARDDADRGIAQVLEDGAVGEETFVMLNLLQPPVDDLRVREALAHATDREAYSSVVENNVRPLARSPFIESSPWHSSEAEAAYPDYDPDRARELIADYEDTVGPVVIELRTTPSASNREATQFLAQMWGEVGISVDLTEEEQATFINEALGGNYTANLWRQFGAIDPDGEYVWWDIQNANDIGQLSLNFARIRSQDLTDAMDAGRAGATFEERKEAYDEAQRIINEEIPYIWLSHTLWAVVADTSVRGITAHTLPDGSEGFGFGIGFSGVVPLLELWVEQ